MQFNKSELKNLVREEVARKKIITALEKEKSRISEELNKFIQECGPDMEECNVGMQEHGDGLGLGIQHLVDEEEQPSAPEDFNAKTGKLTIENFDTFYNTLKTKNPKLSAWLVDFYNLAQKQGGPLTAFALKKVLTEPYKSDYIKTFGVYSFKIMTSFLKMKNS